ncbi:MAG: anti-sigma factor [Actinobacteria bacterium]|nr:anti-sigma factor [Actinomycetota bacterium]
MRLIRQDRHALSAAYALDALEAGAETDRFTRHLNRCPSCAGEVRGFREVATALAIAAAAAPPPELRARVLAAVAHTRQLPPETTARARPRRSRAPWNAWLPWLSGAVAVASIAVAVFFGLAQAHTQAELNQARAENQAIALVLSAPRVRLLSTGTAKGGEATVVLAADRRELVVITSGLPALPSGQVYQLWLIGKTRIASAGLLPPVQAGRTAPVLASGVLKGDALGLTVEPAPGTAQPTTKPILALPLPV